MCLLTCYFAYNDDVDRGNQLKYLQKIFGIAYITNFNTILVCHFT